MYFFMTSRLQKGCASRLAGGRFKKVRKNIAWWLGNHVAAIQALP
jgi:hypothetical protein